MAKKKHTGNTTAEVTAGNLNKANYLCIDQELLWDTFGKTTCDRASDYVRKVQKMRVCQDGSIIATINGTASYVVRATIDGDGETRDACTCPVGGGCKHVVALLLAAKMKFANGETIAKISSLDERLQDVPWDGEKPAVPEPGSHEDVIYEARRAVRDALSTPGRDYAWEEYESRHGWHSYDDDDDDCGFIGEDGMWHDVDEHEGPNYRSVKELFQRLVELNCMKALISLSNDLMTGSVAQIKSADDGDEIADDVYECLKVARSATISRNPNGAATLSLCRRIKKWKSECVFDRRA